MHFIIKCSACAKVLGQCRCPAPNKTITYRLCEECAKK